MKQIIFFVFFGIMLSVHSQNPTNPIRGKTDVLEKNNPGYTYIIIPVLNGTWGYDIYNKGKKMIHQPNVPGFPGNNGFKKKSGAKRVARLVIKKIKSGEMPPSVTIEELKKLKVL